MLKWLARLLALSKMKLYVLRGGKYSRVTGPAKLLDSVTAIGGHTVIGDMVEISSGLFFSGSNSVTNNSINGFRISEMELSPISEDDKEELEIN